MRAVRFHDRRDLRVEDVDRRRLGPDDVRVEVAACGICGSDLHEYAAGPLVAPSDTHPISGESLPITLGHEFAGTVAAAGDDVDSVAAGDRVVCCPGIVCGACRACAAGQYALCDRFVSIGLHTDGGMAESVVVPAETLVALPEEVSLTEGALVEPLAISLHALRRSAFQTGDSIAVFGAGPIGLGVIQAARAGGAREVYVNEPRDARRETAASFGAVPVPSDEDPVRWLKRETDGGVDVAVEAAGVEPALTAAIRSTRKRGNVTVVSLFEESVSTQPNLVTLAERSLTGAFGYASGPRAVEGEFGAVMRMLGDGRLDGLGMVTDQVGLDGAPAAFEALVDPASGQVKVLVEP